MTKRTSSICLVAVVLGAAITWVDLFADRGEISPAAVLLLLLIAGGVVGAMHARFSLALAVLIAICLPATHLALHLLGWKTTLQPDTTLSILGVGLVSLCAASLGVLVGAFIRRASAGTERANP